VWSFRSIGEEVFKESRSIMFKDLRVQRIYDEDKKAVIYVSFNTRLDKGDDSNKSRFKSSLCAVALEDTPAASAPVADVP
jgi:CreA protein